MGVESSVIKERSIWMDENRFFEIIMDNKFQLQPVMDCNQYTQKYGLKLSEQEALTLLEEHKKSLRGNERVEFGEGILKKLIFAFCDSPYIYQDNYVETMSSLQEIFYLYKNESLDELNDDELIEFMVREFNTVCQGSLDYLEDTSLEKFARKVRGGSLGFMRREEDELDD